VKFNNRNVYISPSAKIGTNVKIGDNTSIYDDVVIENDCVISDNCSIGEPNQTYYTDVINYFNPVTIIKQGALIRSYSIIYCGCLFGENFSTGHRVTIRENTVMGSNCRVGTLCDIQGYSCFGDYCWLHSNVHIGQQSTVGNYVFIYPYVVFTNDPHPPSNICLGPTVDDFSQIAVFSVLLPNVKIGKHCLIGAGSIVGKDVDDYSLAVGNPAKVVKDVRELKSRETGKSHYPWPANFSRGMPWEKVGYEEWKKNG